MKFTLISEDKDSSLFGTPTKKTVEIETNDLDIIAYELELFLKSSGFKFDELRVLDYPEEYIESLPKCNTTNSNHLWGIHINPKEIETSGYAQTELRPTITTNCAIDERFVHRADETWYSNK